MRNICKKCKNVMCVVVNNGSVYGFVLKYNTIIGDKVILLTIYLLHRLTVYHMPNLR